MLGPPFSALGCDTLAGDLEAQFLEGPVAACQLRVCSDLPGALTQLCWTLFVGAGCLGGMHRALEQP